MNGSTWISDIAGSVTVWLAAMAVLACLTAMPSQSAGQATSSTRYFAPIQTVQMVQDLDGRVTAAIRDIGVPVQRAQ